MNTAHERTSDERARFRSLIQLNAAVVLFGGPALFAKLIELPAPYVIFGRSLVAALALALFVLVTRRGFRPAKRRDLAILVGSGVLLAAHWVSYFHAVQVSTVAVGTISLHTYPIITVLVEPLVDRTRVKPPDVLLALIVLVGAVVLVPDFSLASGTTRGVLWGVGSAFIFTARNLVVRRFVQRYSGPFVMFCQTAVTALVLLPFVWSTGGLGATARWWPHFLLLGTAFTAVNQSLYASSLRHLSAKTVSIIATLLPLYTTVLAVFILGEIPTARTIVGGAIVIVAVMAETLRAARRPRRAP
ncbi:MAG: DMT family transporter [Spirochaetales bacterium]